MGNSPDPQEEAAFVESRGFRPQLFVPAGGRSPRPHDAVAALLVHEDGSYIMQLRDSKPEIFYPGHWGCFGGQSIPVKLPRMRSGANYARRFSSI